MSYSMISNMKNIVFTDGASRGNPGKGGWGTIVVLGDRVIERGGYKEKTTNNEMELTALVKGLECVDGGETVVYLDSRYVLNGATKWLSGWKENGWKTKAKGDVLNRELWERVGELLSGKDVSFVHIPGHSGIPGNERVDEIGAGLADGKDVELFEGPLSLYDVDVNDLEIRKEKASKKSRKGKAYSYVSVVDGKIETHDSWEETEKRVKGVSGARFKKALSAEDEKDIIASFEG